MDTLILGLGAGEELSGGTPIEVFGGVPRVGGADGPGDGKAIAEVARDLGINEGTLGNWLARDRRRRGEQRAEQVSETERAELVRLRRENATLRMPYRPLLRELGVTSPQYLTLMALWQHSTGTVSELAQRLDLPAHAMKCA